MGHKKTCLKLAAKAPGNKIPGKGAQLFGGANCQFWGAQVVNVKSKIMGPSKLSDSTIISGMNSDKVGWLPVISTYSEITPLISGEITPGKTSYFRPFIGITTPFITSVGGPSCRYTGGN